MSTASTAGSSDVCNWLRSMGLLSPSDFSLRDDELYLPCKDGVLLCKLVNQLQSEVHVSIYTNTAFRYKVMENLTMFVEIAKALLPPDFDLFDPSAFYDGYEYDEFLATLRKLGEVTGGIPKPARVRRGTMGSYSNSVTEQPNVSRVGGSMRTDYGGSRSAYQNPALRQLVTAQSNPVRSPGEGPSLSGGSDFKNSKRSPGIVTGKPAPVPRPRNGNQRNHVESNTKGQQQPPLQKNPSSQGNSPQSSRGTTQSQHTDGITADSVKKNLPRNIPAAPKIVNNNNTNSHRLVDVPTVKVVPARDVHAELIVERGEDEQFNNEGEFDEVDEEEEDEREEFIASKQCIALFPYAAARTDELTFKKGEVIEVLTSGDEGWWEGRIGDAYGWFPSPMVQEFEGVVPVLSDDEDDSVFTEDPLFAEDKINLMNMRLSVPAEMIDPSYKAQVVNDILSTEYEYITGLEDFLNDYASPLRQLKSIPDKAKRAMLGTLIRLVQFQNRFYGELYNEGVLEAPDMAKIFMQYAEELESIYIKYYKNHPVSIEIYKRYMDDPMLGELLKSKNVDSNEKVWKVIMPKNLNQPIEKMKRYPTILRDLARTTANDDPCKKNLVATIDKYQKIADACAKAKKLKEYERNILSMDIDGLSLEQIEQLGSLKYYLPVVNVGVQGGSPSKERVLMLYRGVLVVLNRIIRNTKIWYKLKEIINLSALTIKEVDDNEDGDNLFLIQYDKYQQMYSVASPSERDQAVLEIGQARYSISVKATPSSVEKRERNATKIGLRLKGTIKGFIQDASIMPTKRKDSFKAIPGQTVGNVEIIGKPPVLTKSQPAEMAAASANHQPPAIDSLNRVVKEQAVEIQHLKNDVETLKRMLSEIMKK
eukprot:CFRG7054T1